MDIRIIEIHLFVKQILMVLYQISDLVEVMARLEVEMVHMEVETGDLVVMEIVGLLSEICILVEDLTH